MSGSVERHRVPLEIEVERDQVLVEPPDWELEDLMAALRDGIARPVRVVRGRIADEARDPLSATLEGWADDVDTALRLHWLVADSARPALAPPEGAPRPSLETLVELQALAGHLRRLAERLRAERL